jgi:hypothetical protein
MTILAGSESIPASVAAGYAEAAARMHVVPRGVVQPEELPLDSLAERMPPSQAAEEGCARVETRLSLYLSADDLLAGMADSMALWEYPDPEAQSDDVIRWHTLASLMVDGGPGSPQTYHSAQEARSSEEFDRMRRMIARVFGLTVER